MAIQSGFLALLAILVVMPLARADFQLECPMLQVDVCTFAVSYNGYRCVLEKCFGTDVHDIVCQTSDIQVGEDSPVQYVETDTCVKTCGVDRMSIGFSTDDLTSNTFISKMCSVDCRNECINLVDLYSNIIAGEGMTMSGFCREHRRKLLQAVHRGWDKAFAPVAL